MKTLRRFFCWTMLVVLILDRAAAATPDESDVKLEFLEQALVEKIWLYEVATEHAPSDRARQLERSFCGSVFQIFELTEVADERLTLDRVKRALAASPLMLRIESFVDDPLNIRHMYQKSGVLANPETQQFSVVVHGSMIPRLEDYQDLVDRFKSWLASLPRK